MGGGASLVGVGVLAWCLGVAGGGWGWLRVAWSGWEWPGWPGWAGRPGRGREGQELEGWAALLGVFSVLGLGLGGKVGQWGVLEGV